MAAGRTPLETFERLYRREQDPWGYETRADERAKYDRTLAALGEQRYRRALEIGSSIGVFTAELAGRCDAVVALEPSPTAVARASARLRSAANVELVRGAVPEDLPAGPFDLVVCCEVLYYLSESLLIDCISQVEQRLAAGGRLIAVHYTPSRLRRVMSSLHRRRSAPRPPTPLSGERVHELLRAHMRLTLTHEEHHPTYRLDRFDQLV